MMWITLLFIIPICFSTIQADGRQPKTPSTPPSFTNTSPDRESTQIPSNFCDTIIQDCQRAGVTWTRCYESKITKCTWKTGKGRITVVPEGFIRRMVNSSLEAEERPTSQHRVHIPSSALQRSRGASSPEEKEVLLVISILDTSNFNLSPPPPQGRSLIPSTRVDGTVMGGLVLSVRVGEDALENLPQPVRLVFKHNREVQNGTCVYWHDSEIQNGTGHWSKEGCYTTYYEDEFICSCHHLSFFAVLVNPGISVTKADALNLTYITSTGSMLSVIFTIISLVIYTCLQRRRPEKAIGMHMHLTGALLCLHLCFLLCGLWAWLEGEDEDGWVCRAGGLLLHWSLLATFSWTALEGFHLYLLLVRVFNIYVRRYLLKLSVLGWGLPTVITMVCGILGAYGKYKVPTNDGTNQTAAQICWINSSVISYVSVLGFLALVLLCNCCMLGLVVVKLQRLRNRSEGGGLKQLHKENRARLWKDAATVLGLSCVLGMPWALACSTYASFSPAGIYLFTIFNSLQGVFMFLWSLALTCRSRSDYNSSVKDPSTQKMMETSFNN